MEGDLKTPEGIYFIVQHIGSGLDYVKYGNEAYTLNYPNPVDRLRQKTGYGIWIHGRGEPLVPLQTEGCVAMINEDLAAMKPVLVPGTPVALTSSLAFEEKAGKSEPNIAALERKVQDWAAAWASRSDKLFDFYDKEAYGIAQGEAFSRFQAQKERLFKMLPWIKTTVHNVQVLQGPGYWVTWFYQDYQAPNLTTKGVRRLYWIKDNSDDFKIVGMEWAPGMTTGTLLASAEPALPPIEAAPRTEEQAARGEAAEGGNEAAPTPVPAAASPAPLVSTPDHVEDPSMGTMPEPPLASMLMLFSHDEKAVPAGEWTGTVAMPERKMILPAPAPRLPLATPAMASGHAKVTGAEAEAGLSTDLELLAAAEDGKGRTRRAQGRKVRPEPAASANASSGQSAEPDSAGATPAQTVADPKPAPGPNIVSQALDQALDAAKAASAPAGTSSTENAPTPPEPPAAEDAAEQAPFATSGPALPGPALTDAAKAVSGHVMYSQPATDIFYPPGTLETETSAHPFGASSDAPTANRQEEEAPAVPQPVEPPPAEASPARVPEPPAAPPAATPPPAEEQLVHLPDGPDEPEPPVSDQKDEAEQLASTVNAVTALVEEWRQQWQAGNLEGYMEFYAPKAMQGSRQGARAIQRQKKNLWAKVSPTRVSLSDVRIVVKNGVVLADMRQEYSDSSGHTDTGIKTLTLENINGAWLITREDWSAIPHEAGN